MIVSEMVSPTQVLPGPARKRFRHCESQSSRNQRLEGSTLMRRRTHTCSAHSKERVRGSANVSNTLRCEFCFPSRCYVLTDVIGTPQLTAHWENYERIFEQAAEKDRSRTAQLNDLLAAVSPIAAHSLLNTSHQLDSTAAIPDSRRHFRYRAGECPSPRRQHYRRCHQGVRRYVIFPFVVGFCFTYLFCSWCRAGNAPPCVAVAYLESPRITILGAGPA